ncbi:MAG: hypothetical protein Q9196_000975 [Gyalolechia fulgens]
MAQPLDIDSLLRDAQQHIQELKGGGERPSATLIACRNVDAILDISFPAVVRRLIEVEKGKHESILAGEAYLRNRRIGCRTPEIHNAADQLQNWIVDVILPTDAFAEEPPFAAESKHVASPEQLARLVSMKSTGLQLLSHLDRLQPPGSKASASLTACLASFTNLQDPWTSPEAYDLAQSLLSKNSQMIREDRQNDDGLIKALLLNYVKPLFLKSKTPVLTDQARKAISPLPGPNAPSDFDSSNKPWKFRSPHIVTIFQWILTQLDAPLVEAHWPLIIPPLLTILDDVSTNYKIKGCELLVRLLQVAPAQLLERSGLGDIFHSTLMPYLLYLPSLTPEEESIPLLDAAYPALMALTSARYGAPEATAQRIKSLDAVVRYGILKGHAHAGDNVRIASLLMGKSTDLVNAMGIYCVKHLKDLLPLISATLIAPFATAYPPLLGTALQTLRAIVVNGWPRVAFHRGEILEGLVMCWCRIEDEEEPTSELVGIKERIEDVLRAVVQLLRYDEHATEELQAISHYDARLETLLGA